MTVFICLSSMAATQTFGSGADMKHVTPISKILTSPDQFLDKSVTVKGTIIGVCKKRGCWVKLASDQQFQTLRIKVRDGDMVFPFNSKGKTAYATGQLTAIELDKNRTIAYLENLAKEAREPFDASSVKEGMTIYQLTPIGVTIVD